MNIHPIPPPPPPHWWGFFGLTPSEINIYCYIPTEIVLFLFCTLQKIWRFYLSPSGKTFYSTLHCIHHACIDDVALPLSLQRCILGICTLQTLTLQTTTPMRKTFLLVLTPSKNLTGIPFRRSHLWGEGWI